MSLVGDRSHSGSRQVLKGGYAGQRAQRRVLVIGGAGYIGSALVPKLLKQGYQVRLLDTLTFGTEPIAEVLKHPRLKVVTGDFRNLNTVVSAVQGVDAVIHLGALVGDPSSLLDEELTIETNRVATRLVAGCAKANRIPRFIFASSCSVYGCKDCTLDEQSTLDPVSLYARSKVASETLLTEMANKSFRPTILRFGTVYGLAGRTRFDLVVNLMTAKAILDRKIVVFGAGEVRPFVHVEDVASSVISVLEAPLDEVGSEIFNVGSEAQSRTRAEVGEMIQQQAPKADLLIDCKNGSHGAHRFDFSKIQTRLGFRPEWTIESGIKQVIESIESGKVTDYKDPRYSKSRFLTEEMSLEVTNDEQFSLQTAGKQSLLF